MEYVFLVVFLFGVWMYSRDPKGWNATAKRLSNIIRANIESAKPVKAIEKVAETYEKDKWTAEFEGKELDTGPKHVIVKTWYARYGGEVRPHWKCKCGHADWHINLEAASRKSKDHVREQNQAEANLAKNGGTHAW